MLKYIIIVCGVAVGSFGYSQTFDIKWIDFSNANHDALTNTISMDVESSPKSWNSWARGQNEFSAGLKAELIYSDVQANGNRIIAFDDFQNSGTFEKSDVDFGFQITGSMVHILYDDGTGTSTISSFSKSNGPANVPITEVKMIRKQNGSGVWKIKYYINGDLIDTEDAHGNVLYAYGLMRNQNATVATLKAGSVLSIARTNISCENLTQGELDITVNGGVLPYTYSWEDLETNAIIATTEDVTGLDLSRYEVTVTDATGQTATKARRIYSDIFWTDEVNVNTTSNSIERNLVGLFTQAGSASVNRVLANEDGFIQFRVPDISPLVGNRAIGFSEFNIDAGTNTIEFGLIFFSNNTFSIIESGTVVTTGQAFASSDLFKIRRRPNGNFRYRQNGNIVGPDGTGDISKSYLIDVALTANSGIDIVDIEGTFCNYVEINIDSQPYAELQRKLDGSYVLCQEGKLFFNFDEEYESHDLIYNVYGFQSTPVYTEANQPISVLFGENNLVLDFSVNGSSCLNNGFYYIEVINSKKEKFYLRFKQEGQLGCPGGPGPGF